MPMTLLRYLCIYLATGLIFWLADALWLGLVIKDFVLRELGDLLLASPKKSPAVLFYLLYVIGVMVFAVLPALDADSWIKALGLGALLGLVAYATYDLSNLATLKNWSVRFAVVDVCWGTFVTASAAVTGFLISRAFLTRF
jgi:uncharacterized membrane protein